MIKVSVELLPTWEVLPGLTLDNAGNKEGSPERVSSQVHNARNEFWVSSETTFEELCVDAMRYFAPTAENSVKGRLLNGRMCEWLSEGKVLSRIAACPNKRLRRILLKVEPAELWHKSKEEVVASRRQVSRAVSTLEEIPKTEKFHNAAEVETSVHSKLRDAFESYCLKGQFLKDGGLSLHDFLRFCRDCELAVERQRLALIYTTEHSKSYDGFLSMLCEVAALKYPTIVNTTSPAYALERLIVEHVAPQSMKWESSTFGGYPGTALLEDLQSCSSSREAIKAFSVPLRRLFSAYCVCNPAKSNSAGGWEFLTPQQFQLLVQDFEFFSLGAYLDARVCFRIFLDCCSLEEAEDANIPDRHQLGFEGFGRAMFRLSCVLATPFLEENRDLQSDSMNKRRRIALRRRSVARALLSAPTVPLKGMFQHLYLNIFCRSFKLKALCDRIEERQRRRGKVTPLGTQMDISKAAAALSKIFIGMWNRDGRPEDYFSIAQKAIENREIEELQELEMMLDDIETRSNDSNEDMHEGTHQDSLKSYDEVCVVAEDLMRKASEGCQKHIEWLVKMIFQSGNQGMPKFGFERAVTGIEEANMQFLTLTQRIAENARASPIWWRWAVAELACVNRCHRAISRTWEDRGKSNCTASWWMPDAWNDVGKHSSREVGEEIYKVCHFLQGCLGHIQELLKKVLQNDELASKQRYRLGLDQASAFRLDAHVRITSLRLKIALGWYRCDNEARDFPQLFSNIAKEFIEVDMALDQAATCYEQIRFSQSFRVDLLNNWSFVLFERAHAKALAQAALQRAAQLNGSEKASSWALPKVALNSVVVREQILRAREVIGLGFELSLPTSSAKHWFLPVILLWTWTNCINLNELARFNVSRIAETSGDEPADGMRSGDVFQFKSPEAIQLLSPKAQSALRDIFGSNKGKITQDESFNLLERTFSWDKNGYYVQIFDSQMTTRKSNCLEESDFMSLMLFVAFHDPIGFVKSLYVTEGLKNFGVEDSRTSSNRAPTTLVIASALYPTFEDSTRARRRRRSHISRLTTLNPLRFNDDHASPIGSVQEKPSVEVKVNAATPEANLIDYFLVMDARSLERQVTVEDMQSWETFREAIFEARIRDVWPPATEDIAASDLAGAFSLDEIAEIKLLREEVPLPDDLLTFCFQEEHCSLLVVPSGDPRAQEQVEEISTKHLVLTDGMGIRRFGTMVSFFEEIDPRAVLEPFNAVGKVDHLLKTADGKKWFARTCIMVLSRWPFFQNFAKFLRQIRRIALCNDGPPPLPLERYIANFVSETPLPSQGGAQVQCVIGDLALYLHRPPTNSLPLSEISFVPLFENLSVSSIVAVFACLLTEQKVALCSANDEILTVIAEALRMLLFPFEVQGIYIPVLPAVMSEFLFAPVPFLMGVHSSCVDLNRQITPSNLLLHPFPNSGDCGDSADQIPFATDMDNIFLASIEPQDVVFVDLDSDRIILPVQADGKGLHLPQLPKVPGRKLRDALFRLSKQKPIAERDLSDQDVSSSTKTVDWAKFENKEVRIVHAHTSPDSLTSRVTRPATLVAEELWTNDIRNTFIDFQARILRNFKRYIKREKHEINWSFDRAAFLSDHASLREFCTVLFDSQLFEGFLRDTIAILNGQYNERKSELQLFDELTNEAENRAKAGRLYARQKKQPAFLLNPHDEDRFTEFIEMPRHLDTVTGGASSDRNEKMLFPKLNLLQMRSMKQNLQEHHQIIHQQVTVPFTETELRALKIQKQMES